MGRTLEIETHKVFLPLLQPARYKGAHGGRGSGKSHFFAGLLVACCLARPGLKAVCIREVQKDLKHSAKLLIEHKIREFGVQGLFRIKESEIITPGGGVIIFQGMQNHTADSIKSLEGFDIAWIEEAQTISQRSLDLLRPTIRKDSSEIWASWNPDSEDDPIDRLLRGESPPEGCAVVEVNYTDNPKFPDVLRAEMETDRQRDFDKFLWTWLGRYRTISDAVVFRNWEIKEFVAPDDALFRFGLDFGFAADPTAFVRCYLAGKKMYIDHEAVGHGVETDFLPDMLRTVPEAEKWPIIADSARPETISYLQRHGFGKIMPAVKGKGSVEEGIEFLKSYQIIIHPRCTNTIRELRNYSYKVDKNLVDEQGRPRVLPVLEDKNNHVIDALRMSCESARRAAGSVPPVSAPYKPRPPI